MGKTHAHPKQPVGFDGNDNERRVQVKLSTATANETIATNDRPLNRPSYVAKDGPVNAEDTVVLLEVPMPEQTVVDLVVFFLLSALPRDAGRQARPHPIFFAGLF